MSDVAASEPLLALKNISKSYGSVRALTDICLDVLPGQVMGLVGDNGAGKSTLVKVIAGIDPGDAGEIVWKGSRAEIRSPNDATRLGIATVFQDLALCDNLDIVENLFLGRELLKHRLRDETAMELGAKRVLSDLSVVTVKSVRQTVGSLSGGQRQAVAVARAIMINASLVILDEPTAALGVSQTMHVLDLIRRLAERGIAVIVITHNLNHIFEVANRLAVLYLGRLAAFGDISDFDSQSAVELITTGTRSQPADAAHGKRGSAQGGAGTPARQDGRQ